MLVSDLATALANAESGYFRLVLLVGPPESGKTPRLRDLAAAGPHPIVSVAGPAAARLLEFTERQRRQRASEVVTELVEANEGSVILLDDIELLFEPTLAVDPLRLLQSLARNRTVVAAWPGTYADGTLTYADSAHPEHRIYRNPEAIVVRQSAGHTLPA